jgi:hypothetical protein
MHKLDKETIAKQIVATCTTSFRKKKWPQSPFTGRINRVIVIIITDRVTVVITRRILSSIRIMNQLECPREMESPKLLKQMLFFLS